MISVLGIQRIAVLAVLIAVNVLLSMLVFSYLNPQLKTKDRELNGIRGNVSTLTQDVNRMQVGYDLLLTQRNEFEAWEGDGFFRSQDRRQAEKIFKQIQKISGVGTAKASLTPAVSEESEEAKKADYKVLKSTARVTLTSADDISIFHYLFLLDNYFPGHISFDEMYMERTGNVSNTVLRAIASDLPTPLVRANIDLTWRTMIPEDEATVEGQIQ